MTRSGGLCAAALSAAAPSLDGCDVVVARARRLMLRARSSCGSSSTMRTAGHRGRRQGDRHGQSPARGVGGVEVAVHGLGETPGRWPGRVPGRRWRRGLRVVGRAEDAAPTCRAGDAGAVVDDVEASHRRPGGIGGRDQVRRRGSPTVAPSGVNGRALSIRLAMTRSSRPGSARTSGRSSGTSTVTVTRLAVQQGSGDDLVERDRLHAAPIGRRPGGGSSPAGWR